MHGGNVMVRGERPRLIDFGRVRTASGLLDPLTLLLSFWLDPDGVWFDDETCPTEPAGILQAIAAAEDLDQPELAPFSRWIATVRTTDRE
jgi:hypothetical protein